MNISVLFQHSPQQDAVEELPADHGKVAFRFKEFRRDFRQQKINSMHSESRLGSHQTCSEIHVNIILDRIFRYLPEGREKDCRRISPPGKEPARMFIRTVMKLCANLKNMSALLFREFGGRFAFERP